MTPRRDATADLDLLQGTGPLLNRPRLVKVSRKCELEYDNGLASVTDAFSGSLYCSIAVYALLRPFVRSFIISIRYIAESSRGHTFLHIKWNKPNPNSCKRPSIKNNFWHIVSEHLIGFPIIIPVALRGAIMD